MLTCLAALAFWASAFSLGGKPPAAELLREADESYRTMHSEDAVRLYREYLIEDPANASARIFLGAALLNLKRTVEAKHEVQEVLASNPSLSKAYVLLGRIDASENSWDLAQQSFAHALRLDPRDRDALYFSGRAFYDANQFEPAIARFKETLAKGATQSRTYENLALCYEALNLPAKAEEAYRSAIQGAGDQYRPYLAYGRFLFKQSRVEESLIMLGQAFDRQSDITEVRFELARALYHVNRLSDATQVLTGALASNECRVHNLMTKILASEGQREAADREIRLMADCVSDGTAAPSGSARH